MELDYKIFLIEEFKITFISVIFLIIKSISYIYSVHLMGILGNLLIENFRKILITTFMKNINFFQKNQLLLSFTIKGF